jgi:ABC-type multidrug transport system fused ATPase/permease subunit
MSSISALIRLTRFSGRYFLLCTAFSIFVYLFVPLVLGLLTQAFFNSVGAGHAGLNTWTVIGLLVAVQATEAVAGTIFLSPWSPMQQKCHVLLRRNLFAGILNGYGQDGLPVSPGEVVTRFRDDPEMIADALDALADLIGRAAFAVVAGVIMWRISAAITATLFVPLLLCSVVTERLGTRIMAYRTASRAASGRLSSFLADLLEGQLAIKVAGSAPQVVRRLDELGTERRHAEVRDSVFGAVLDAFDVNLGNLGAGVVLLLGAEAIHAGTFTVGDFALFVVYLDALAWLPDEIGRLIGDLKRIDVSLGRMHAVVPSQPLEGLVASPPVYPRSVPATEKPRPHRERLVRLEVEGLTYNHPGVVHGIEGVSFVLKRGTITVVSGRVGAGKTTLLEVLLGLLPQDAGRIAWNGSLVQDPSTFFVPPRSTYTPQVPCLFSETVRENILLGQPSSELSLNQAVHAAVLERDLAALEHGLDTPVGTRGVRLSGGQVQRVAAARMFIRDADLLVVDDLSSALDPQTEAELWDRLFARRRGETWLVVSHRAAALNRADQVLWMEGGRILSRA